MALKRKFGFAIICWLWIAVQSPARSSSADAPEWKSREKFEYRNSTFILESRKSQSPPERLRVLRPGHKEFQLQSDGWSPFKAAFSEVERYYSAKSLVSSEFVLAVPGSSAASDLLFMLMAEPAGSSPGRLDVLRFNRSGKFSLLLSKDELHLNRIVDLDGDGRRELVVSPCFHQSVGPHLSTYDPFHVYKLSSDDSKFHLSLPLTKKYNLQHYAGWAGPNCSEKLVVQDVPNGKPRIRGLKDIDEGR